MNTLEIAAKYICTSKCGLCPMVVETFTCPQECHLETKAWQCWMTYFRKKGLEKNSAHHIEVELLYDGLPQTIEE